MLPHEQRWDDLFGEDQAKEDNDAKIIHSRKVRGNGYLNNAHEQLANSYIRGAHEFTALCS